MINLRHKIERHPPGMHPTRWYYQERMKEWTENIYENQKKIVNMHINETRNIHEQLLSLQAILPQVDTDPSMRISRNTGHEPMTLNMNLTFNQPASLPITVNHGINFPPGMTPGFPDTRAPRFLDPFLDLGFDIVESSRSDRWVMHGQDVQYPEQTVYSRVDLLDVMILIGDYFYKSIVFGSDVLHLYL